MLAAALIALRTLTAVDYLGLLDRAGMHGGDAATTPLKQVIPAHHADAQMWIRHAIEGSGAGQVRVRYTTVDNAPAGREVHWSSGLVWMIRGAAALQEALGGQRGAAAFERVLLWFNAPLLLGAIMAMSAWTAHRLGGAAGVLMACAMIGHPRFFEAFTPTYVDHHGLVNIALLGFLLGAAFMGFGWWRPEPAREPDLLPVGQGPARRAAVFSGLFGACALWLSAAAALPAIALTGFAGLASAVWLGRQAPATGARFDPGLWRLWGRTGAVAAVAFHLMEYAPAHMGWRLEVNHPLHAVAWWGGAELVALVGAWQTGNGMPGLRSFLRQRSLILPLVALAAAPLAVALGGGTTFLLGDPFIGELRHYVAESRSLPAMWRIQGTGAIFGDLVSATLLVPAVLVFMRRRDRGGAIIGALTGVVAALVIMAFFVMRWWLVASPSQIVLLVWVVALGCGAPRLKWVVTTTVAGLFFILPSLVWVTQEHNANGRAEVAEVDLFQPLYRDVAATLRAADPGARITLLSSPNASAGISYFGRFQSVGTLFWENTAGLRGAAEMLCAETDDEALRLMRARGVTHVAMFSAAPFVGEYFKLLHPERPVDEARRTFGFRLAGGPAAAPRWLQPIPYRRTPDLARMGGDVGLYKVVPEQSEDRRLFAVAVAQAARGEASAAEQSFLSALPYVPSAAQASFLGFAGEAAYEQDAHGVAVRLLRRSLALAGDSDVANLAAWILATSPDPAVRDGNAALALVAPIAKSESGDPAVASTLAAAYAETGRFEEAIAAAERALALVRQAGGEEAAQSLLAERLATYRERRPWRQ